LGLKNRKDDARRWIEMKNKMDTEMKKLKTALKREKEKNVLLVGGAVAGGRDGARKKTGQLEARGVDENSVDKTRAGKTVSAGKRDTGLGTGSGSARAPLRSIFTPRSQEVEDNAKREEVGLIGRADIQDGRQLAGPARIPDPQPSTVRFGPDQTRRTALPDVFTDVDVPAGPSTIRGRPIGAAGKVSKSSSSGAEEKDRTMAEQVLDTPARRTSRVERVQEDIGGSTTEEDEEPQDVVMSHRHGRSLRLEDRRLPTVPPEVLPRGNMLTRTEDKSNSRTAGPHSPRVVANTTRATSTTVSKTVHGTETPNAGPSRHPASVARTGSRVTRTPSGMQWLGGEKGKLTRRDSFEDEVGTSSRVKPQGEVVHTLPRAVLVKASATISAASTSKLPAMKRLVGRPEDNQHTPTRASNASSLKRKDMIQLETPAGLSVTPAGTARRSEKRQKLTATR
jgi:hypothetical protein